MTLPDYKQLANSIKLLAHPERLRILDALRRGPECVCHLEAFLDKPQPYVSQQLRVLREAGVIQDEKRGLNVYYHLVDPEVAAWLETILGPVDGEHPEMVIHKERITCECPECGGTLDLTEIQTAKAVTTNHEESSRTRRLTTERGK